MTTESAASKPTEPAKPAKKSSLLKWIGRLFLAFVVLMIVGILVLYFARNTLVVRGVEFGGKTATKQDTLLNAADLSLSGKLGLSQLQIHNLATYTEPQLLTMKDCKVDVDTGSFLTSTIVVNSINISGLDIYIEQDGMKNNLAELMDIIKANSPAASPAPAGGGASAPAGGSAPESPGRALQIKRITLTATKVHLRGIAKMDLDLGDIQMDDVTNPDGRAVKIADVFAKVLLRVSLQAMQQIANDPRIPVQFKDGLKSVNDLVNGLKGNLLKGDLAENLKKFNMDSVKNIGNDVGKQLQGLQNLIPGQKPATNK